MRLRRLLIGLMIGILALMALLPVVGVRAQSGPFTYTFDFEHAGTSGWALEPGANLGVFGDGVGWKQTCAVFGGDAYEEVSILYVGSSTYLINSMDVVFDRGWPSGHNELTDNLYHDSQIPENRFLAQSDTVLGQGSNLHLIWSGADTSVTNLGVVIGDQYQLSAGCPLGGSVTIKRITVSGSGSNPFPTLTPTLTPTPPPIGGFVPVGITCQLIQTDTANFNNLPGAWQLTPEGADGPGNPTGQTTGLHLAQGSATLNNLSLSSAHKYKIDLNFHVGDSLALTSTPSSTPSDTPTPSATPTSTPDPGLPISGTIFGVTFGKSPTYNVQVNGALGPQSFTIPAANYIPDEKSGDADIFHLKLENLLYPDGNNTLVIDSVCVSDTTPGQGVVSTAPPQGECKTCNRPTDLFDIGGWIQWLGCGLGQLFDCVLKGLLMGLWKTIVNILQFLSFIRQWIGLIFQNGSGWLVNVLRVLWAWLSGAAGNILIVAGNILAGLLNGLGLTRLINTILTVLTAIPSLIANVISGGVQWVVNTADTIGAFWGIITYWATKTITLIGGVIGAVPIMISSLVAGLNASATTIPTWAPSCTSTNTFFYGFCLTSYIIDNTIFDGPLFLIVPVIMGFVGWLTITWTMNKVRKAVTN